MNFLGIGRVGGGVCLLGYMFGVMGLRIMLSIRSIVIRMLGGLCTNERMGKLDGERKYYELDERGILDIESISSVEQRG